MVFAIDAEDGVSFSIDVRIPKPARFDDRSDVIALINERTIRNVSRTISFDKSIK
jgi:hypothetical protein